MRDIHNPLKCLAEDVHIYILLKHDINHYNYCLHRCPFQTYTESSTRYSSLKCKWSNYRVIADLTHSIRINTTSHEQSSFDTRNKSLKMVWNVYIQWASIFAYQRWVTLFCFSYQDLINYTPPDHPDYVALQKAQNLSKYNLNNFAENALKLQTVS